MPLTLECTCSADAGNCTLSTLTLVLDISEKFTGTPTISNSKFLSILANPADSSAGSISLPTAPGHYSIDLPLNPWAKNFNTIAVELDTASSLPISSSPPFSRYDLYTAAYTIIQTYTCDNLVSGSSTGWNITSYTSAPDPHVYCEPTPGDIRDLCWAGHAVNSIFYESSPLAPICQGCTIIDRGFAPPIDATAKVDPNASAPICLCATGGSGDYSYSVVGGSLPSGQSLNVATGCIEGTPDGVTPGSESVTFQVNDRGGAGAPVGTSRTIGGTGYLDGSGHFIWASGAAFFSDMVGTSITVNGLTKTVATVTDVYHMTVS